MRRRILNKAPTSGQIQVKDMMAALVEKVNRGPGIVRISEAQLAHARTSLILSWRRDGEDVVFTLEEVVREVES